MKKYYKNYSKEFVYEQYFVYIENSLHYEKITRYKMVDAMKAYFFEHMEDIVDALPLEAFEELQMIAKTIKEKGRYEKKLDYGVHSKIHLFAFLFDDYDLNERIETFYMNASLSQYLSDYNITLEIQENKYFEQVILGMVSVYGAIINEDMELIYQKNRPSKFKHLAMPRISKLKFFRNHLIMKDYTVYMDAILHPFLDIETLNFPLGMINKIYDLHDYYKFSVLGHPPLFVTDREILDFSLLMHDTFHSNLQFSDNLAETMELVKGSEIFNLYPIDASMIDFWPIWKFGGMTYKAYLLKTKKELIDISFQEPFLDYVHELVRYANKKYKYLPKNTEIFAEDALEIIKKSLKRKYFLKHLNASDARFKSSPFLEISKGFENAVVIDMGVAYKYERGKLLVFHDGIVYHVSGITTPISENVSEQSLPLFVSIVIIPLSETLTYALSFTSLPVAIGANMRALLDDEIRTSKHVHNLNDIKEIDTLGSVNLARH